MKKPLLKLTSSILSATMLLSSVSLFSTSAQKSTTEAESPEVIYDIPDDNSTRRTGDLTPFMEPSEDVEVISSVEDYYNIAISNGADLKISAGDEDLPTSADNSQSPYFPPINDQKNLGSCVPWAQVYYQFTYTMNKSMGVTTTADNAFSPKFAYNYVNTGEDDGSSNEAVYQFMQYHGNVPISMVPYDEDYLSWTPTENVWKTAIEYKIKGYQNFDVIGNEDTKITSADDEDLKPIKAALSNGEVLAMSTFANCFRTGKLKENSEAPENSKYLNEKVVTRLYDYKGGHRMAVVGYNDNLWVDINNNNKVDSGEMGAFKVANSWGDDYGNKGFIWVAYDSINQVSCVENCPVEAKRTKSMTSISRIDVEPYNKYGDIYLKYTLNTADRNSMKGVVTATVDGTEHTATIYTTALAGFGRGEFSFDGTTNANDGTMVLSLNNVLPEVNSENLDQCHWSVTFYDTKANSKKLTVKNAEIVDEKTNRVFKPKDTFPFTLENSNIAVQLIENQSKNIVVYYRGYNEPTINYQIDNGSWQSAPMTSNIEKKNYVYKYVINLKTDSTAKIYFSDSNGNTDKNNGSYYTAVKGLNYFVTENVAEPLVAKIIELPETSYDVGQATINTGEATGGYEPYQYQFIYKNLDTGKVTEGKYSDKNTSVNAYYNFPAEGNYRITLNVKDYADKVATTYIDVKVTDRDFYFTELNLKQGDQVVAGQPFDIYSTTKHENIISRGNVFSMYDIIIKKDGVIQYSTNIRATKANTRERVSTIEHQWTPYYTGTYTVSISSTDGNNQYAEKFYTFEVKDHKFGDVDCNTVINIRDATLLQMFIARFAEESEINFVASDVNKDTKISISDATAIQMSVAHLDSSSCVGDVIPLELPPEPTNPPTEPTNPTTQPTTKPTEPVTGNKVYFTNSHKWSGNISCYYWSDSNKSMTTWPGKAMTLSSTNEFGESIYTFDVPSGATYVIFTNGSSQTVDIKYGGGVVKYYPLSTTDSQGHYQVGTW